MANYPTSLDTITNPTSGNTLDNPSHSLQHSDANDILEALERKVGIGSSVAGSATAGHALVASTGGTTSWTTIGTAGISSGTATSGQVLTANGTGGVSFVNNGLVLINTTSFTNVATQDITSVFSSTYTNYRIIFEVTGGTGNLNLRLLSGSTPNTTAGNYRWSGFYSVYTSATITGSNSGASSSLFIIGSVSTIDTQGVADIIAPFDSTKYTAVINITNRSDYGLEARGGALTVTTSYDGYRLYADSGNITGRVSTYGYNK